MSDCGCNVEIRNKEQRRVLIAKHRKGEIHMRASWVFSKNDVIANIGVIMSGALVALLASPLPDLIIGFVISMIVMSGGISILRDADAEKSHLTE